MASRYLEPRLERASTRRHDAAALRRLREQVRPCRPAQSVHRRKLRGLRPDPAKLRTLDDLRRLPFTTKDELKENQAAHPPWGDVLAVPLAEVLRVHLTSATTGRPLAFLDSAADW
jgi:phenylacetate-CoA ligase